MTLFYIASGFDSIQQEFIPTNQFGHRPLSIEFDVLPSMSPPSHTTSAVTKTKYFLSDGAAEAFEGKIESYCSNLSSVQAMFTGMTLAICDVLHARTFTQNYSADSLIVRRSGWKRYLSDVEFENLKLASLSYLLRNCTNLL